MPEADCRHLELNKATSFAAPAIGLKGLAPARARAFRLLRNVDRGKMQTVHPQEPYQLAVRIGYGTFHSRLHHHRSWTGLRISRS